MKEILKEIKLGQIIGIYHFEDSCFTVGKILKISSEYLFLLSYDINFKEDGIKVFLINSIKRIILKSDYIHNEDYLIFSEKGEFYDGTIKVLEENTTYTINGSTVTAQKISKNYSPLDGTYSSTTTSIITYTLDTKKRPIKIVEVSENKDTAGNITQKNNKTFTYQYANHHSFSENIKGMDKLNYSSVAIGGEDSDDIFFPISYAKKEINETLYHSGSPYQNGNYTRESMVEYTLNTNNYPTKIQFKTKDPATGQYKNSSYYTIEYNK